jgi:hypothetical protein
MDLIQAILTSSFTFQYWYYSYQKDERANPGDLRTNRYSSSPPNIEMSLSLFLSLYISLRHLFFKRSTSVNVCR